MPVTAPTTAANNTPLPKPAAPKREPLPLVARQTAPNLLRRAPIGVSQHTLLLAVARTEETPPLLATRPLPPLPLSSPIAAPSPKSFERLTADTTVATAPLVAVGLPSSSAPLKIPGGLSIARQLGLGVSRIVIDPGHGGHDSGAMGKGVSEAELVLDVALRLEKLLLQVAGVEVILTRRTDDFVELPERTAMANREGADLFLSIHANASTSALPHGVETYFLNFATNLSAAAVAARENADSTQAMASLPDLVKAIALNNKVDESHELASHVQNALIERLRTANKTLKDLGVKQAPFVVLIGAAMPSALAEISFVTNPQEARLLKSNAYRQRIAEALFDGVRKYQTSLKAATTISTQR
jgi:N-acetylmuramoyl-L-alanine amidase